MTPKEIKANHRKKTFLVKKFVRTYKYIAKLLKLKGFHIPLDIITKNQECFRGFSGIFINAERVGPGIVGTLYCCSNCKGYPQVLDYLMKTKKLPEANNTVKCIYDSEFCDGVLKPVILYPLIKKNFNKPFKCEIPSFVDILLLYVIGRKKFRARTS